MPGRAERPEGLLFKARNDLALAGLGLQAGVALDGVCFHAQQAVEKALKAVLALHQVNYPFTHDLATLVGLSAAMHAEIREFEDAAEDLMQYAVAVRYDEEMYPDGETAAEAVAVAERVLTWASGIVKQYTEDS